MSEENRNYGDAAAMDAAAVGKEDREPMEEITIKFAKGLVGEPFVSRDGTELVRISIPNSDPKDHAPWQEFVLASRQVHENKFGKGMWAKIPAEGHTTVSRPFLAGQDETGRNIWEKRLRVVSNRELKEMVEFYKTRDRGERSSTPQGREASQEGPGKGTEPSDTEPYQAQEKAPPGKEQPSAEKEKAAEKRESIRNQIEAGKKEAAKENRSRTKTDRKTNREPER